MSLLILLERGGGNTQKEGWGVTPFNLLRGCAVDFQKSPSSNIT